ncbi:hypothetical protein scyTo_0019328 [Scyliorhinus torazame]|uniref:Uncharacterized protein n=1 Tax=Scyliorhinus torazame TaxID=75743 RepID=A0A401PXK4_SCYTO|nr:hypothetical protein [Scyliorhinus torazame]
MSLVDLGKRLLEAARKGQDDEVRTLMANGAPFTTDWLGTSPLHLAAQYGHYSTAEVLLRAGVSRDARTKVDRTPLHMAAAEGHANIVELLIREAMQNQVNTNPERTNSGAVATPQFIIAPAGVMNLAGLVSSSKTTSVTEEVVTADSVDSAIQQVVGSGGQRVITIVTDGGVQLGNLPAGISAGQPFIVTMQDGQQGIIKGLSFQETNDCMERELLQKQLHEANRKAQEYRQQLMKKEQEAEEYRMRLEAIARLHTTAEEITVVEEVADDGSTTVITMAAELEGPETTVETMEQPTDMATETVTS